MHTKKEGTSDQRFLFCSCLFVLESGLMKWLNEPPVWQAGNGRLRVVTAAKTDFWRVTHYGFVRDNGHFYYEQRTGDFTVQVKIKAKYESLYDQAGIMIRLDPANWIKTGVEYTDGQPHFSAVVTRDFSDWSVLPSGSPDPVWLRLTKLGSAVRIQYSVDGLSFPMLRLAYFPESGDTEIGLMCCSPEREGFEVEFNEFQISEPINKGLHE
jgi:regulation of enolase protein 1 (concanavalin A-like superfamily)